MPILSDSGILPTPLGTAVLGTGVAGEFWPIIVMSIFLTGVYGAAAEIALLVVFGAITIGTAFIAMRARPPRIVAILRETLHSTGQAAVRLSIALIAALVLLARDVGFDFVLGAFAAGLIVGLVLDNPEGGIVRLRLEGIGFGLLIPIYFVATGLTFDLDSLLTARGLGLAALFLAPPARRPRDARAPLAPGSRPARHGERRVLRRDGAPARRRDRRHRHGPRGDHGRCRRVADRRRDGLGARLPAARGRHLRRGGVVARDGRVDRGRVLTPHADARLVVTAGVGRTGCRLSLPGGSARG